MAGLLADRVEELWLLARDSARAAHLREAIPGGRTPVADLAAPEGLAEALADQRGRRGWTRCCTLPG
ncbi:hypothetical protein [Kitasatospora sp. NPDC059571]|uniref:hypothetical protein n=1 Tax=Kitasatospora sp. NPDC059571 TaxID=3346871 RepID=UPI003674256B